MALRGPSAILYAMGYSLRDSSETCDGSFFVLVSIVLQYINFLTVHLSYSINAKLSYYLVYTSLPDSISRFL